MTTPTRRVVQHVTAGAYAGLRQILGTTDEMRTPTRPEPVLPAFLDNVDLIDHRGSVTLVSLQERYVLYRETPPTPEVSSHG